MAINDPDTRNNHARSTQRDSFSLVIIMSNRDCSNISGFRKLLPGYAGITWSTQGTYHRTKRRNGLNPSKMDVDLNLSSKTDGKKASSVTRTPFKTRIPGKEKTLILMHPDCLCSDRIVTESQQNNVWKLSQCDWNKLFFKKGSLGGWINVCCV